MDIPRIGDHILGREVTDLVAIGGQAAVVKATSPRDRGPVAIKVLGCDPGLPGYDQELARARRSAGLRIGHRCVVDAIDSGMDRGRFCTVFPFVPGDDLNSRIMRFSGGLRQQEAAGVILDVADGLAAIHAKNVVHRDIKTDNIIIDAGGKARIIDLGICRLLGQPTLTTGKGPLGTPGTMAPEQFLDPQAVDQRADVYSLGVVAFVCLTGHQPFRPDLSPSDRPAPIPPSQLSPSVAPDFDHLCLRMLALDRRDRFQTAREVLAAWEPVARRLGCVRPGLAPVVGAVPRCLACGTPTGSVAQCRGCKRPFAGAVHRLVLQTGPGTGEIFDAPQGTYVVGRAQLCSRDQHMSRRQAQITCVNGDLLIADSGGANPTLFDDKRIESPITLHPGARVRLGVSWATYLRQ